MADSSVTDDKLDTELREHGVLIEDDMSLQDKRDLYNVLKMSESTHLDEVTRRNLSESFSDIAAEDIDEQENCAGTVIDVTQDVDIDATQDVDINVAQDVMIEEKFDAAEQIDRLKTKGVSLTSVCRNRSSSPDVFVLTELQHTPRTNGAQSSLSPRVKRLSLNPMQSIMSPSRKNGAQSSLSPRVNRLSLSSMQSIMSPDTTVVISKIKRGDSSDTDKEVSPARHKENENHKVKHQIEPDDSVRNIDVWNCERVPTKTPLDHKRPDRGHPKPFYVVPPGMNCEDYIVYFKKHIDTYAAKLVQNQRKSLDIVPWGPPIGVGPNCHNIDFDLDKDYTQTLSTTATNERYSFRGRKVTQKRANDSNNIDSDSSSDDIFIKKVKKHSKEVMEPSVDMFDCLMDTDLLSPIAVEITGGESEATVVNNGGMRPTRERGVGRLQQHNKINNNADTGHAQPDKVKDDSDEDYEPSGKDISMPRNRLKLTFGNSARKNVKKPLTVLLKTQDEKLAISDDVLMNTDDSIIIKPGPLSKKIRIPRLGSASIRNKKEKVPKLDDEQIAATLHEDGDKDFEKEGDKVGRGDSPENVACPMCMELFTDVEIQAHADICCEASQARLANYSDDEPMVIGCRQCPMCDRKFESSQELTEHMNGCVGLRQKRRIAPPKRYKP